jgi:histidine ammonia-lyase
MSPAIEIKAGDGPVSLASLRAVLDAQAHVTLSHGRLADLERSAEVVRRVVEEGRTVYGVNTGFGLLANTRIPADQASAAASAIWCRSARHRRRSRAARPRCAAPILVLKIASLTRGALGRAGPMW